MKEMNVAMQCLATYNVVINVPDEMELGDAIRYMKNHIDKIPVSHDLVYVPDSDEVDEENCFFLPEYRFGEEMRPGCDGNGLPGRSPIRFRELQDYMDKVKKEKNQ